MGKRRCPVCRSRQWHKDASGLVMCSEGHVLQNYRIETSERGPMGPHAMRKRTIKVHKVKDMSIGRNNEALYHGARARYFYFECLQLLLRMQVKILIEEWGLPAEFETICRDIWAMHLSLLPRPPVAEPYLYAKERGLDSDEHKDDSDNGEATSSSSSSNSDSDSGDEKGQEETMLADLLKAASESESSEEDEPPAEAKESKTTTKGPRRVRLRYEVPAGNIAVLMMACWTMRLPVMYKDFIRVIEAYKLPYLEAARWLPPEMKRHLARETMRMLSPHFAPTVLGLHELTSRLARLCWTRYGIHTPEVNAAPVLWRTVRAFGGTATLYGLTKTVARELSLALTLHPILAPALVAKRSRDPKRHRGDNVPAELGLVGTVIVVLKLIYGMDGRERDAMMEGDPGRALSGWDEYVRSLDGGKTRQAGTQLHHLPTDPRMTDADMDEYLVFCQHALLPGSGEDDKTLAEFFPLDAVSPSSSDGEYRAGILPAPCRAGDTIPAGHLRIYHSLDTSGVLPAQYQRVLDAAADFCGVDAEDIAAMVERYERRLARRAERGRRQA
ncbi:hypothetical protein M422DRAFT_149542 [Sphaerobolus stellatus SS14]|nr:hypothetical protein M422DRAFT_149542 [Sphaerobolus stellatus SS14]